MKLLIAIAKFIALLAGIAMLIGGGLCSFITPLFLGFSETIIVYALTAIALLLVLLYWLTIKLYEQYRNYLLLLIAGFFLAGGGLCANEPPAGGGAWGLLLLNIAVALSGYALIRWWITSEKKPPEA
jgi:hypothetical protein